MKNFDQKYNVILKEQEDDRMKGLQQLANYKVELLVDYRVDF